MLAYERSGTCDGCGCALQGGDTVYCRACLDGYLKDETEKPQEAAARNHYQFACQTGDMGQGGFHPLTCAGGGGEHSGVCLVFVDGRWRCPVQGCQHTQEPFEPWEAARRRYEAREGKGDGDGK